MIKVILATILALTVLFLPAYSRAPASTDGEVISQVKIDKVVIPTVVEGSSIKQIPRSSRNDNSSELALTMPLAGPSRHTDYVGVGDIYRWGDLNNDDFHIYGVENGRFFYQPGDTWFIYGVFGPIEATRYDWNVKYTNWGGRHNGIDFAVAPGTPVLSASGGEVIFTGVRAGNTIVVKTDNFHITYSHLQSINVEVGERVAQGQLIGYTGASGTINPHLHFQIDEFRNDGKWGINPAQYLPELEMAIMPNVPTNRYIDGSYVDWDNLASDFRW